jgi:Macrocin-O-methyltransferase (TylF)
MEKYTTGSHTHSRERTHRSSAENDNDQRLLEIRRELLDQLGPFWNSHQNVLLKRQSLSRLLYYRDLYQLIVDVPGVICEFGVHWGATLTTLINLRGIYEPFNYGRHIFGFDTFEGFATVTDKDGGDSLVGDYSTARGYETVLEEILALQESFSPVSHIRKFSLIKGDASVTAKQWLQDNPHAIVSMLILDMDVYQPTLDVLNLLRPRLTKGSVLVFDELSAPDWPGETRALDEAIGLSNLRLRRHPNQNFCAYAVYDG